MRNLLITIGLALVLLGGPVRGDDVCNSSSRTPAPASCYYTRNKSEPLYQRFLRAFGVPDNGAYRIAVLAGVSEYKDKRIDALIWAHRDLTKLFNTLRDQHLFDEIIVLENEYFTIQNLSVWLNGPISERIKGRNGVQFLFAFSGHGIPRKIGSRPASGMLLVQNSDKDHIERDAISFEALKALLQPVVDGAFQSLILVNSCFSGNLLPPAFGEGLYDKGKRGAHVITAGDTDELTFPTSNADDAGSVFFDAFLEGLRGAADLPSGGVRDGVITVDEIARYVREKVIAWTRGKQNPSFDSFNFRSDGGFFFWSEDGEIQKKEIPQRRAFALLDKPFSVDRAPPLDAGRPEDRLTHAIEPTLPRRPCHATVEKLVVPRATGHPKSLSTEEECALERGDVFRECDECPEMVVVPAGSFTMGSPESEKDHLGNEGPQHRVTIAQSFAVGKFHITVDQFWAFWLETNYADDDACAIGAGEVTFDIVPRFRQTGTHPVVCLTWNRAKPYVNWLAGKTGRPYRLLTEAEWEYAARARTEPGTCPPYFYGDDERRLCQYGNVADQTAKSRFNTPIAPCADGYIYTSPVGTFMPNSFGLYDMLGNAFQWTEDCYHGNYSGAPSDGSAWTSAVCTVHVLRGGAFDSSPRALRTAYRAYNRAKSAPDDSTGLRVGRTIAP